MYVKNKTTKIIFATAAALTIFSNMAAFAFADFDPNKLIDDATFSDIQTFGGAAGIQQFLQSKGSVLANTDPAFLQSLKEPVDASVKNGLQDPEPNLPRLRTAAELIWDASIKTGLNPQVILVTLQKEQSLITGQFPDPNNLQRALNTAFGFGCPDSGGCDQAFVGFYYQLFGNFDAQGNRYVGAPGSLMRSFNTPNGRGPGVNQNNEAFNGPIVRTSHVGDTIVVQNTLGGPQNPQQTQSVTIANSATAALYRYTPHIYNGNYNFWKYFQLWFKYPNGTLVKLQGDSQTYIINNGLKSQIPNFVMQARGLNPNNVVIVSPTEFSSYDNGPLYTPADNTIIKIDTDTSGKLFVFDNAIKHSVSAFVLQQRGLNATNALTVTQQESDLFQTGPLLTPKDGTLIRGQDSKAIYVIQNSKREALTAFTFKQYSYSFKNVVVLPNDEVPLYEDGGFLLPKNGTLVSTAGDKTVYQLQDGLLHPISYTVFKLRKLSFKNVNTFSAGELASATIGNFIAPPDGTYFAISGTSNYFLYKNGSKHVISAFVAKQRNVKRVAVSLSVGEVVSLPDGFALPPVDGTLVKSDQNQTIFAIIKGQKVALDYNTWVKKYRKRMPTVLSQAEIDSYPSQSDIQQ